MIKNKSKNKTAVTRGSFVKNLNNFISIIIRNLSLVILITIAWIILIFDINQVSFLEKAKHKAMSALLYPVNVFDNIINKSFNYINLTKDLFTTYQDNRKLSAENEKLKHYYVQYKFLQYEYEELKRLLLVQAEPKTRLITAKLVGINQSTYNHNASILLSDTTLLKKGQLVINEQGVVGKIKSWGENYARVQLINDPTSRIPVTLISSKLKAIVSGNSSNCLDLLHVAEEDQIKLGELVLTSNDGNLVAPGQLIGRIEKKGNKHCVKVSVDLNKIEYVMVIDYSL